jgi:hypothetical protein
MAGEGERSGDSMIGGSGDRNTKTDDLIDRNVLFEFFLLSPGVSKPVLQPLGRNAEPVSKTQPIDQKHRTPHAMREMPAG